MDNLDIANHLATLYGAIMKPRIFSVDNLQANYKKLVEQIQAEKKKEGYE